MVEGVTSEELALIRSNSINVTAISSKDVRAKLLRAGFSQERAAQIREANQPQFRVYGARSPGAIPQTARLEAAKELGLLSTTKAERIAAVAKQRGRTDVSTEREMVVSMQTEQPRLLVGDRALTREQLARVESREEPFPNSMVSAASTGAGIGGTITEPLYQLPFISKVKLAIKDIFAGDFKEALSEFSVVKVKKAEGEALARDLGQWQFPGGTVQSNVLNVAALTPGVYTSAKDLVSGVPLAVVGVTPQAAASIISGGIAREVNAAYQKKINEGNLLYNTPEEQTMVNLQFEKEVKAKYQETSPSVYQSITERQNALVTLNPVRTYGTIGLVVGSLVVASPSVVGYGSAILARTGLGAIYAGTTSKYVATALFNPELTTGQRIFTGAQGVLVAGTGLWLGASAFGGTSKSLLSQWNVKDLIDDLSKTKVRYSGKYLSRKEGDILYSLQGERMPTGSAKQTIKYNLLSLRTGTPDTFGASESGQRVLLERGREGYSFFLKNAESTTKVWDFVSGQTFTFTEGFGGGGRVVAFGQGLTHGRGLNSIKYEQFQTSTGSYYLTSPGKEGFKPYKFFGAGIEREGQIFMISGTPKKIILGQGMKVRGVIEASGIVTRVPEDVGSIIRITGMGSQRLRTVTPSILAAPQITTQAATQTLMTSSSDISRLTTPSAFAALSLQTSQAAATATLLSSRNISSQVSQPKIKSALVPLTIFAEAGAQASQQKSGLMSRQALQQRQPLQQITQSLLQPAMPFPSITPRIKPQFYPEVPPIILLRKGMSQPAKYSFGRYSVFGRRFGVFKPLGTGRTLSQAFRIGKRFAGTTLGATFKIPGARARKLKGFTTKYTKQGILYIEPRGRRLKRGSGEVPEINLYRSIRRRRR